MKPSNSIIKANLKIFFTSLFLFLFFTFSSTSAITSSNEKPTDAMTLLEPYTRAPEDRKVYDNYGIWTGEYEKYYFFTIPDSEIGYIPYFRVFVPPGMFSLSVIIIEGGNQMAVARHKIPPVGLPQLPPSGYTPDNNFSLQELIGADQWATESMQGYLDIARDHISPPVSISDAGWLYVKVDGGQYSHIYVTNVNVGVNVAVYNTWWDKYVKNEAGWKTHIESVETYIDPSI